VFERLLGGSLQVHDAAGVPDVRRHSSKQLHLQAGDADAGKMQSAMKTRRLTASNGSSEKPCLAFAAARGREENKSLDVPVCIRRGGAMGQGKAVSLWARCAAAPLSTLTRLGQSHMCSAQARVWPVRRRS
jgi:hypothetical protein